MDSFTFTEKERLKNRACIQAVFKKGVRVGCGDAGLFFLPNGLEYNRFLCTFKRGFGSATERNRARRLSKEVYRQIKNRLKTGYDMVLLVFSKKADFSSRVEQMFCLFKAAKLYKEAL